MRRITISCDVCKTPCPQQNGVGGILDRTWLEMHVTHGAATYVDLAFCVRCKDDGPTVYRAMMRRLAEEERKVHEMRELMKEQERDRLAGVG